MISRSVIVLWNDYSFQLKRLFEQVFTTSSEHHVRHVTLLDLLVHLLKAAEQQVSSIGY